MVALASRLGADDPADVAQEAFLRLHSAVLLDDQAAAAYLRTTVVNLVRSAARHRSVARRQTVTTSSAVPGADDGAAERITAADTVHAALLALPAMQREVVVLRYWLDLTTEQIALTTNTRPAAVRARLSRAVRALGKLIGDVDESED